MREKTIEQALTETVKSYGGIAVKLVSPGFVGMPDRLVLLPDGRLGFIEVKAPGKKPRAIQTVRHKQLRQLGFKVYVLDNPQQIPEIIKSIRGDFI